MFQNADGTDTYCKTNDEGSDTASQNFPSIMLPILDTIQASLEHTDTSMTYCQSITKILRIIWVRCIPLNLRSKTRRRATPLLPTWIYSCRSSDGQLRTSLCDKRDDFNFHITNFPFLGSNIPSSPAYGVFISQLIRYAKACSSYECFILRAARLSSKLLRQGYVMERTFEIVPQEVLWSIWGSHQTL